MRRCSIAGVAIAVDRGRWRRVRRGVAADPVPSPSFNGPVYAVAYRGDTVYVGGTFTGADRQRQAGRAATTGRASTPVPARCSTGRRRRDANVRALAVDGDVVYAAGDFDKVPGTARDAVAGIDATTGALTAPQARRGRAAERARRRRTAGSTSAAGSPPWTAGRAPTWPRSPPRPGRWTRGRRPPTTWSTRSPSPAPASTWAARFHKTNDAQLDAAPHRGRRRDRRPGQGLPAQAGVPGVRRWPPTHRWCTRRSAARAAGRSRTPRPARPAGPGCSTATRRRSPS